jgi:hypothetical protein
MNNGPVWENWGTEKTTWVIQWHKPHLEIDFRLLEVNFRLLEVNLGLSDLQLWLADVESLCANDVAKFVLLVKARGCGVGSQQQGRAHQSDHEELHCLKI